MRGVMGGRAQRAAAEGEGRSPGSSIGPRPDEEARGTGGGTAERGAPGTLTCCSSSEAENSVAFAQGLGAQGLRAPL